MTSPAPPGLPWPGPPLTSPAPPGLLPAHIGQVRTNKAEDKTVNIALKSDSKTMYNKLKPNNKTMNSALII